MIFVIVSLCIISIVIFTFINMFFGKTKTDIDLEKYLINVISEKKLNIKLLFKEKTKPYYDCITKEMLISKGNKIKNIAEGFHELGHAIDDFNTKEQETFSTLSYLIMKYSIAMAIVLYYLQKLYTKNYIPFITLLFCFISIFFFSVVLKEEITATKYGLLELENCKLLTHKLIKLVKICMYNALLTYFILFFISIIITGYQLIYLYKILV